MNQPKTEHRPDKEELLAGMQSIYGDVVSWEDLYVTYIDDAGDEVKIANPTIVLKGNLNPGVTRVEEEPLSGFEDAKNDLTESDDDD